MVALKVLIIVPIETTIGTVYRNYLGINEYPNSNILGIDFIKIYQINNILIPFIIKDNSYKLYP